MEQLQPGDPRRVGDYQVLARLGAGGMGQVFLARSRAGREVALKLVHPALAGDPEFRERFRREVSTARAVSGAFTAPVVGADPDAQVPWLATAYLRGLSLHHLVATHGPLPPSSVIALAAGLAEALIAIHDAAVVHRDLKPSNVMLTPEGPRVIDFGIARAADGVPLTTTGSAMGSPGYMAPEQLSGTSAATAATDVFALGAVLGYAATGANPFGRGPAEVLLYRILRAEPDLEPIEDAGLRDLVGRCLSKDPGRRPTPDRILSELADRAPAPETLLGTDWLPVAFSADITGRISIPPSPPEIRPVSTTRRAALVVGASGLAGVAVAALGISVARRLRTGETPEPGPSPSASATPAALRWQRQLPVSSIEGLAISGGLLFVAAGESGVHVLDAARGTPQWRAPLQPNAGANSTFAPLVLDGTAYLRDERTVNAYELGTGQVRWTHELPAGPGQDQVVQAAKGLIVAASRTEVVAFDAGTGDRRWGRPVRMPEGTASVIGDVVCVMTSGTDGRMVLGLDLLDGRTRWTRHVGGHLFGSGVVTAGDDTAYAVSQGRLYAVDAADGTVRWSAAADSELTFTVRPVPVGQQVYLHDRDGHIYSFAAATGKRAWKKQIATIRKARDSLDLYGVRPLGFAGLTLMYDHGGHLLALDQGTGEIRWQTSVEQQMNKQPVVTRGSVHVTGINSVVSIQADTGRVLGEDAVPLTFFLKSDGDLLYLVGETTVSAMRIPV
ncbi:outer membrane protein assembly factor BamB family protein [Nonomuraea maritima]|uniref:outer membrane protein assembly factor BamB family protein n=1 Tax=Nonomuraea maritima TaxID=683260 RepID=UPI00371A7F87